MIRLGRISYVNMAPLFWRLDAPVEEVPGVPTALNQALLAGEVDLAPISSIEYARNAERLRILPRLCVSSEGAVDSIQLVSRAPLDSIASVAVTPESATSVALVRILLPDAIPHLQRALGAEGRVLVGVTERNLLVAATLRPEDAGFAAMFSEFVIEQSGGADEPVDRRLFELVDGRLVEFT